MRIPMKHVTLYTGLILALVSNSGCRPRGDHFSEVESANASETKDKKVQRISPMLGPWKLIKSTPPDYISVNRIIVADNLSEKTEPALKIGLRSVGADGKTLKKIDNLPDFLDIDQGGKTVPDAAKIGLTVVKSAFIALDGSLNMRVISQENDAVGEDPSIEWRRMYISPANNTGHLFYELHIDEKLELVLEFER